LCAQLAKKEEALGLDRLVEPETPLAAAKPPNAASSKKEKGTKVVGAPTESREKGVQIKDLREGKGAVLVEKKGVRVGYTGKLADGTTFDEGFFTFKLGSKNVIEGWNIGLRGARVRFQTN
jgi:FKBP-type peptidyl-prolyl cis-trans isomerase